MQSIFLLPIPAPTQQRQLIGHSTLRAVAGLRDDVIVSGAGSKGAVLEPTLLFPVQHSFGLSTCLSAPKA